MLQLSYKDIKDQKSENMTYRNYKKKKYTAQLKWYYDENHIFPIAAILLHRKVACVRRKIPNQVWHLGYLRN